MNEKLASAQRAQQLLAEQVSNSFGAGNSTYVIAALVWIGAFVEGFILWPSSPHDRIILWVVMVSAAQIFSFTLITAYRHTAPPPNQASRWGKYKSLQTSLLGLAWGSSIILLHVPGATATLLVPAMAAVAVTVASTTNNATYPPGMYPLLLGNTLPGILYLFVFSIRGPNEIAVGYALVALLAVVITVGRVTTRVIHEAMSARMDLLDMATQERKLREETELARSEADVARAQTARFFSAASHDLRQPLHALGLYSGLLRNNPTESERLTLIESVDSCVDSLERLFNGILGISEAELLQSRITPSAVPLQAVLNKVHLGFRQQAEEKGLQLRLVQSSAWVNADSAILERILSNLVVNAINYTKQGKVLIGVRRRKDHCLLVVADTGLGINEEHQKKIFSELYQVGNSGRDRRKGFGLGLSIVKRLCDALNVDISVQSTPDRGSLFSITLERTTPDIVAIQDAKVTQTQASLHVLLIEDDEMVRDAMLRTLHEWQVPALACSTGEQALTILKKHPEHPWHVLIDYRLADAENGLDVADRILDQITPAPPMTMLTGETDEILTEGAARRGIVILSKPLKPLRLRTVLMASKNTS